jgi:peptide chain release factor subunit 1
MLAQVKKLLNLRSVNNSTSLITLYIPGKTKISDMNKFLTTEISQSNNIKARVTRQGVHDALQGVSSQLKLYTKFPDNGIVIFSGTTTDKKMSLTIEPPRPINRFFYCCDTKYYV